MFIQCFIFKYMKVIKFYIILSQWRYIASFHIYFQWRMMSILINKRVQHIDIPTLLNSPTNTKYSLLLVMDLKCLNSKYVRPSIEVSAGPLAILLGSIISSSFEHAILSKLKSPRTMNWGRLKSVLQTFNSLAKIIMNNIEPVKMPFAFFAANLFLWMYTY